jgi:hypothetical protein
MLSPAAMRSILNSTPPAALKSAILAACVLWPLGSQAAMEFRFVPDTPIKRSQDAEQPRLTYSIDTATRTFQNSDDNQRMQTMSTLSGASSSAAQFELTLEGGYDFDFNAPRYDQTPYAGAGVGTLRQSQLGWAPRGTGNGFSPREILHFTVSGLAPNQCFVLTGFAMGSQNPERMDFFYQGTVDPKLKYDLSSGPSRVDGAAAFFDVTDLNVVLKNGERFAWGWASEKSGNRSGIRGLTFDIVTTKGAKVDIPEPASSAIVLSLVTMLVVSGRPRRWHSKR